MNDPFAGVEIVGVSSYPVRLAVTRLRSLPRTIPATSANTSTVAKDTNASSLRRIRKPPQCRGRRTYAVADHSDQMGRYCGGDGRVPGCRCETRSPRVHGSSRAGGRAHQDPRGWTGYGKSQEQAA